MKLQYNKQYIRKDGKTTGFLVNNNEDAIEFPFLDPVHGVKYDDRGWPKTGESCAHENSQRIVAEIGHEKDINKLLAQKKSDKFDAKQEFTVTNYNPNIVIISQKDYDRFKALEAYVKQIATFAKENGL